MHFTELFIRRPILSLVVSLIILLLGVLAYFALPTRLYPKADTAVISIFTDYSGADVELVEGFITTPIENAMGGVEGIDYITSRSSQGFSYVQLHFKVGYDINSALNEVNGKISGIRYQLPIGIKDPVVEKYDSAARPTMYLNFASTALSSEQIADYLRRVVQPQLQTLPGMASADVLGADYAMRVWLNPELMSAYNITFADIENALTVNNLQMAGGQLENAAQLYNVKTVTDLNSEQQFANLVIKDSQGHLIKLQDVAKVELGPANKNMSIYTNGKRSTVMAIVPLSTANPLAVSSEIHTLFGRLQQNLPSEISASIFWDSSKFISESIKEVKKTILEAAICVILIMFLFLGSWRTLLIPAVTIPLSLFGVCAAMYVMNYSLNTLTFLAFVLAIGVVVDDAIVITENIHRYIIDGQTPLRAAILGAKEIQFAIVVMTFTLAAVFIPVGFLGGLIGSLFKEFAFVLAGAVIISGLIALILSPMMCSRVMTHNLDKETFVHKVNTSFERLKAKYMKLLTLGLKQRAKIILGLPLLLIACISFYLILPKELAPKEDVGSIITVVSAPTSASLSYTEKYTKLLEPIFQKIPEIENFVIVNGDSGNPAGAFGILDLKPWSERKRTSDAIIEAMSAELMTIPGVIAQAINPSMLPGADAWGGDVELEVQTTGDYLQLNQAVQKLLGVMQNYPGVMNVNSDLKVDQQQINIQIDRDKAAAMGVSVKEIAAAINIGTGAPAIGRFSLFGRNYEVIPQLQDTFRNSSDKLNLLQVRTASGALVPLANLVTIKDTIQPQSIEHFQQLRTAAITASVAPGYSLNEVLKHLQETSREILAKNMQLDYGGASRIFFQSSNQMQFAFILSLIFIFLVLAAQFESFRDPLIVLITAPLSTFGALLVMWLTNSTLNIYSEIGLITLIGLITKHGILMVQFANQSRIAGNNKHDAIILAAATRLRPIMMTTAAMLLGAMPLVLAHGVGAISRRQIGLVIAGGMLLGTLFTLFVVPVVYYYLAGKNTNL